MVKSGINFGETFSANPNYMDDNNIIIYFLYKPKKDRYESPPRRVNIKSVNDVVKGVVKLAIRSAGIPLP